jgi:Spy/CpxP family protein refolding chaperone
MRSSALVLAAALVLAGCGSDVSAPDDADLIATLDAGAILSYDAAGLSRPGHLLAGLHRLPEDLKLTSQQAEAIRAALEAFERATRADREALAAIHARAREAIAAGKSRDEVRGILAEGDAIRQRLEAAEAELLAKLESILTAAQKAWLDSHKPGRCDPASVPPLTEAQRTQIRALIAAFEVANQADLAAVRAAHEQAAAARRNGATAEQVRAILAAVRPAIERLAAAQAKLHQDIQAVLTDEQKASGCYRGLLAGAGGKR